MKLKEYADSGMVFQRYECPFENIHTYIRDYTQSGDWIIPLCGNKETFQSAMKCQQVVEEDTESFMGQYDDGLFKIYRHQDADIVLKNTKMLGDKNPNHKGLIFKIILLIDKLDKLFSKLPKKIVQNVVEKAQKAYDEKMTDKATGICVEMHIWIPLWRTTTKMAFIISILGRINIVLT